MIIFVKCWCSSCFASLLMVMVDDKLLLLLWFFYFFYIKIDCECPVSLLFVAPFLSF